MNRRDLKLLSNAKNGVTESAEMLRAACNVTLERKQTTLHLECAQSFLWFASCCAFCDKSENYSGPGHTGWVFWLFHVIKISGKSQVSDKSVWLGQPEYGDETDLLPIQTEFVEVDGVSSELPHQNAWVLGFPCCWIFVPISQSRYFSVLLTKTVSITVVQRSNARSTCAVTSHGTSSDCLVPRFVALWWEHEAVPWEVGGDEKDWNSLVCLSINDFHLEITTQFAFLSRKQT